MSAMPWLADPLLEQGAAILVTVASAEGSVPRETGAAMLVTATHEAGTIGGGHLEWCAIGVARQMLAASAGITAADRAAALSHRRRLERLLLGPTLGQCCGGVVHLAFERVDPAESARSALLTQRWQQGLDTWRVVSLDTVMAPVLVDRAGRRLTDLTGPTNPTNPTNPTSLSPELPSERPPLPRIDPDLPCHLQRDADGKRWLVDPCLPYRSRLVLFGAGHVGAAIVRTLADLPCHVTWVDERAELFPAVVPANVSIAVTDTPEEMVDAAAAGASYLVMTHSHPLDQRLAERILARADIGWFGLIGSRTKRIRFERRLRERGVAAQRIAAMTCPVGVEGIDGKAPAMIAIAVAAQLLQVWERQATAQVPDTVMTRGAIR